MATDERLISAFYPDKYPLPSGASLVKSWTELVLQYVIVLSILHFFVDLCSVLLYSSMGAVEVRVSSRKKYLRNPCGTTEFSRPALPSWRMSANLVIRR